MNRARVMLVEDSESTAIEIQAMLRELEYELVGCFGSGEAALEAVQALKPDLILMDIHLDGEQDGVETAGQIREMHDAPVVFLSGHDDKQTVERARSSEPYGYVLKPPTERGLDIAIRVALDRHGLIYDLRAHAAALEESQRDLAAFATLASHDLMEPIRSVLQNVTLLRENGGTISPAGHVQLDRAERSCRRMNLLVEDLQTYTRLGLENAVFRDVPLGEAVARAQERLVDEIKQSGATILASELPTVRADPRLLALLLQNLFTNSIRYRGSAPPCVEIRAEARADHWEISVEDNGQGIEPHHLARVFEPFKRLHSHSDVLGTGIGLTICRRIAECHSGEIWAESSPGQGTTMRFTLSRAEADPK